MIDLADLSKKVPPKQKDSAASSRKEEAERRPVSIRLETVDAHKKRIKEEKLKAKRDSEAKERVKRDQEEKGGVDESKKRKGSTRRVLTEE